MKPIGLGWKGRGEGAGSEGEGRGLRLVHNYIYYIFAHLQQINTKRRTFQAFWSFGLKSVDISGYCARTQTASETNSEICQDD